MDDPPDTGATHRRIADIVRSLHDRSEADSETVVAEPAEHAVAQIPGAQYAGVTVTTNNTVDRAATNSSAGLWPAAT